MIERTTAFLEFLGNPQEQYSSVHIAGTGGKGSVAVMTGVILQTVGFKTGVHTSPYLQVPGEKWMINRKMISPNNAQPTEKRRLHLRIKSFQETTSILVSSKPVWEHPKNCIG